MFIAPRPHKTDSLSSTLEERAREAQTTAAYPAWGAQPYDERPTPATPKLENLSAFSPSVSICVHLWLMAFPA